MELDLLRKRAEKISPSDESNSTGDSLTDEFRLLLTESFNCSGTMTGLLLVGTIKSVTGPESKNRYPQIHIWRHTDNGSTYTKQDMYSQEIRLTEGKFSPDGVLQYNLTTPIPFQSGDLLGVYQPPIDNSVVRLYYDDSQIATNTYQISGNVMSSSINLKDLPLTAIKNETILISPISS